MSLLSYTLHRFTPYPTVKLRVESANPEHQAYHDAQCSHEWYLGKDVAVDGFREVNNRTAGFLLVLVLVHLSLSRFCSVPGCFRLSCRRFCLPTFDKCVHKTALANRDVGLDQVDTVARMGLHT
jgi:hypothetical protein